MQAIRGELTWVEGRFQRDLAVTIDSDRIVEVGTASDLPEGSQVQDWGRVAIIPGTVNCHGHAFQNLLKGFADDRPFDEWRDRVLYPFSEDLDADAIYVGALFAFAEALLSGTTTTVDFFYLHDEGNSNAQHVIRAAHDIGIRLVLARAFYDPDAPTRAPRRYRERAEDAAARLQELASATTGDALVSVQPAPHSLHAASPATIRVALESAAALDVPCHLHLAEARYEVEQVRERYGTTPVRLLHREGLLDERLVTVHGVWLDDEELDLLAEAGSAVIHCPGANAFLGDGVARLPEMLKRGVRVALGPDGGCANNRQSMFDEMRMASLLAKARLTDGGAMDAAEAFRLGTSAGADVLGLPVGELSSGRKADLVALDLDDLSLQPIETLDRQIVNSIQPTAIERVMVEGRMVVEQGELTSIDRRELVAAIRGVTRGWTRS